jgi:malate dehydrogenase
VVVGNPCNTNCMIAAAQAKRLPKDRFTAMVRLDQNRAVTQLAQKAGVPVSAIENIYIYGNHSPTMFADFTHATIGGKPVSDVVTDRAWLENDFLPKIGKRGAEVLAARGLSSAASAGNAMMDHVRDLATPGKIHSVAVESDGSYGFDKGIWVGVPVKTTTPGSYEVIKTYEMSDFAKAKIKATNDELVGERETVKELLG